MGNPYKRKRTLHNVDATNSAETKTEKQPKQENLKYDRLEMTCLECKTYNELYGTNYSYGEYVAKREYGWLEHPIPIVVNPPKKTNIA